MTWNELSMSDRARYIQLGVQNKITNLNSIRQIYNEYAKGGHIYDGSTEDTQQMQVKGKPARKKVKVHLVGNRPVKGEHYVGDYIKVEGEWFWRRVNSDGTATVLSSDKNDVENRGMLSINSPQVPSKVRADYINRYRNSWYTKKEVEASNNPNNSNFYNKDIAPTYEILPGDLKEKYIDRQTELLNKEAEFIVPLFPDQQMTISKGGINDRARGAVITKNQLDSIAMNAYRYNTKYPEKPISLAQAIGIQSNESMFASPASGRRNVQRLTGMFDGTNRWKYAFMNRNNEMNYASPITSNSAWTSMEDVNVAPYADAANIYKNLYYTKGKEAADEWWNKEQTQTYFQRLDENKQPIEEWNPYFNLYNKYLTLKNGRSLANYNEPGYYEKIVNEGTSLLENSPEIKDWYNERGKHIFSTGELHTLGGEEK